MSYHAQAYDYDDDAYEYDYDYKYDYKYQRMSVYALRVCEYDLHASDRKTLYCVGTYKQGPAQQDG